MFYRTILFSLVIGVSLLNFPVVHSMEWGFWTRENYKHTWIAGGSAVTVGLIYSLWKYVTRPEAPGECYARVLRTFNDLCDKYKAKIAAFERGYHITGNDLTSKNEQLESARQEWLVHIDEEALSHLGVFTGNWRTQVDADVKKLSLAKIDLSKMRRQMLQENKDLVLVRRMENLLSEVSLLFLQMSFLRDCTKHNELYLDLLDNETTILQKYAHVVNISPIQANLKQIICSNSTEKSHQYVKFIQGLNKDILWFTQKINQVQDNLKNTKLFYHVQRIKNALLAIEKRIYADKTLHNDLRVYQIELLGHMKKKAKILTVAIDKAQVEADKVRALEGRLSVVIAAYSAYQNWNNQQGRRNIPIWEMDKLEAISVKIEKAFSVIQKARNSVRSLEKERIRMQVRFDEANISVPEQISLQIKIEETIQGAESTLQTIKDAENCARKAADDLHSWARNNNLFLV